MPEQKYRKKPVVISAFKFGENNTLENAPAWYRAAISAGTITQKGVPWEPDSLQAEIKTPEGTMTARHGDYIIQGIKGEIYPCKADIFTQTYEPAD